MAEFYTSVAQIGKFIKLIGYKDGVRIKRSIAYKPYLFQPTNEITPYKTLQGQYVERKDFSDVWEAKDYLKSFTDVAGAKVNGIEKWVYQYIHDSYPGLIEFDKRLIKVLGIDIEVDSQDGFPDIELANREINAIAIRQRDKKVVFGFGEYTPHQPNITYLRCKDEKELLTRFLTLWNTPEWTPDVVTGWNLDGFDIPYLVKRISNVLGENCAKLLSPWRALRCRTMFMKGKTVEIFHPVGISVLDYMRLYQKFQPNEQSSYSLNNIAHVELKEKKLDYSEYMNIQGLMSGEFDVDETEKVEPGSVRHMAKLRTKIKELIES